VDGVEDLPTVLTLDLVFLLARLFIPIGIELRDEGRKGLCDVESPGLVSSSEF